MATSSESEALTGSASGVDDLSYASSFALIFSALQNTTMTTSAAERPGQEAELSAPTKDRPPRIRRPPHNLTVQRPRSAIVKPTPRRGVAAPGLQPSAPSSGSPPFYRFSAVTLRNGAIVESILAEEFCGLLSVNEGTKPDPDLARCASALAMR